jgi:GH24 family phage-related lysozyme (muramidase)
VKLSLIDFFKYYKGEPHQDVAIRLLEQSLPVNLLDSEQPWYKQWQNKEPIMAPTPSTPAAKHTGALALIKEFEGCVLHAYPDPGTGGEPYTIGYGNTFYNDGSRVKPGQTITQAQAEDMLAHEVERVAATLSKSIPTWNQMNANQQSALISFSYNVGPGWFGSDGFGTITRTVRNAQWSAVPDSLKLYVNPGTSVTAGLKRRRAAEGQLWSTPVQA